LIIIYLCVYGEIHGSRQENDELTTLNGSIEAALFMEVGFEEPKPLFGSRER